MSLDLFVGRAKELHRFQVFLAQETLWVLLIRGLGGSGKSALLNELAKQMPQDTCVVTLELAHKSLRGDSLTLLEEFSQRIESFCDPERIVEFRKSIHDCRYEIGKRIASGNTEIGEIKQGITAGPNVEIEGAGLRIEVGEANNQETRRQMREIAKERFYAQIKTFAKKRLVIILDTCEWLNEETKDTEAIRWAVNELIPGLNFRMRNQGKQCFLVMASRVSLTLEGIKEQEQWQLKMLDRVEVNQYLDSMGIQEPTIQDFIFSMTYGHPHCISIVSDICEEKWDGAPQITDLLTLQDLFLERALQEVIDRDILKHFIKSPLDELTRYGVLLRRFNLPLLRAVFQEWLPDPEASDRFEQLIRYPHVEPLGRYNYTFLKLLRDILACFIRVQEPDKWKRYHQLALEFLKTQLLPADPPDWYYHQLACDEEQGVAYWNEIKSREPLEYIEALREVARDKTLKLTLTTTQCMDLLPDALSTSA